MHQTCRPSRRLVDLRHRGRHAGDLNRCVSELPQMNASQVPSFDQLMLPLFNALRELGGSGSIAEIDEKVGEDLDLSADVLDLPHNPEKSNQTEFQYRLAWARTYLKQYRLIENSSRGDWVIAPEQRDVSGFDPQEVVRTVRDAHRQQRLARQTQDDHITDADDPPTEAESWRDNSIAF